MIDIEITGLALAQLLTVAAVAMAAGIWLGRRVFPRGGRAPDDMTALADAVREPRPSRRREIRDLNRLYQSPPATERHRP